MSWSQPASLANHRVDGERSKWCYVLIVVAIALVTENASFEFTLVSPALRNIAMEFQTTHVSLVMTVVFVASLVFLPIAGKLADIYGKKKILLGACALFALGSMLCALAPAFWLFLVGRVCQSVFVIAYVTGYGLIRDLFPARLVPLGVGALGIGTGVAALAGPLLGGYLIDSFGFRSTFWFVFCYDVVVAVILLVVVPETRVRSGGRIDFLGALLLGVGMAVLVLGVSDTSTIPIAFPASAVLLVLFVLVERRCADPMISMQLLAGPKVWLTLLAAGLAIFVATPSTSVLMAQIWRAPHVAGVSSHGFGFTALQQGLYFGLEFGLVGAAAGIAAGWVCRRFAPRTALLTSVLASMLGVFVTAVGFDSSVGMIGVVGACMGVGLGFFYAGANNLIIEAVPADLQGVATSLLYIVLGVVNAISTAVVGAIAASRTVHVEGAAIISDAGTRISFYLILGVGVVAILVMLAMRHGRTPASGGAASDQHSEAESQPSVAASELPARWEKADG